MNIKKKTQVHFKCILWFGRKKTENAKSAFPYLLEALFPLLVVTFGAALTVLLVTFTTP